VHSVLRKAARLQELRADLLHVMGFEWNLDAVLAAWLQGIPVVLHVHVPESADFKNLHRFAASKVLFCSNFEKQNFSRLDRIQSKAEVLHNCIDVNQYANGTSIRPALGIKESDIVIGTVAQLTHRKGIDLLLDAAEILLASTANLVFLIVGRGHPEEREFESRVRARAELAAMKGRVCFLGSRSDVPDLLASMDLFLLPSRAEPFGIVILEAMAAGLPVVASAIGGIPEIITSGELGCLVEPLTGDSFAAAINKMLETPDRGRAMGQRARQSLYGRFDKAAVGRKLQRIYSDLVSAKRDLRISPRESRNS
jgi:glycosyltransferase involved in cell wall biosynthesis